MSQLFQCTLTNNPPSSICVYIASRQYIENIQWFLLAVIVYIFPCSENFRRFYQALKSRQLSYCHLKRFNTYTYLPFKAIVSKLSMIVFVCLSAIKHNKIKQSSTIYCTVQQVVRFCTFSTDVNFCPQIFLIAVQKSARN